MVERLLLDADSVDKPFFIGSALDTSHDFYPQALAGRSLDAKRSLYKAIMTNLELLGIPKDHVKILLREVEKENSGIRGGQAGCDVDLGFKIDV